MIIVAETLEENELVAKLAKEHSCRAYERQDAFGFTVWSIDDLKSKQPDISDADALSFLENYENRLRENCISGGWDFFDYADYSECPSLNKEELPNLCCDTLPSASDLKKKASLSDKINSAADRAESGHVAKDIGKER